VGENPSGTTNLSYNKTWYDDNRSKCKKWVQTRVKALRRFVASIKASNPCTDCGEYFPSVCMDFDHVAGKERNLAEGVRNGWSEERLLTEIGRCELVCSNCHRIRTFCPRSEKDITVVS
jgi:hypothetical protein